MLDLNQFKTSSHPLPLIPESERETWSKESSIETDIESSIETDIESSDASIYFERKFITKNNIKHDVSFLRPEYKSRKGRGSVCPLWPRTCTKTTPDKFSLYKIIKKLHKYQNSNRKKKNISKFVQKYRNYHSGYKRYISKIKLSTWTKYSAQYKIGSAKYETLKKYIKKNKAKTAKRKKRFYLDPDIKSFGLFRVFEEYLVKFREVVANEYEWRSLRWLRNEGKRILKNERLLGLLKPFMERQEWRLLRELKCSRNYISNIVVILYIMIIHLT